MTMTRVEIDFFKPIGFSDVWFVETRDRGLAAQTVMNRYDLRMLSCVNAIVVNHCDLPRPPNRPADPRQILQPIVREIVPTPPPENWTKAFEAPS